MLCLLGFQRVCVSRVSDIPLLESSSSVPYLNKCLSGAGEDYLSFVLAGLFWSSLSAVLFWSSLAVCPSLLFLYRRWRRGRFFFLVFVARLGLLGFYSEMAFRTLIAEAVFLYLASGHSRSTPLALHRFFPPVFRRKGKALSLGLLSRYQITTPDGCLETLLLEFISRGSYEPLGHF